LAQKKKTSQFKKKKKKIAAVFQPPVNEILPAVFLTAGTAAKRENGKFKNASPAVFITAGIFHCTGGYPKPPGIVSRRSP